MPETQQQDQNVIDAARYRRLRALLRDQPRMDLAWLAETDAFDGKYPTDDEVDAAVDAHLQTSAAIATPRAAELIYIGPRADR